MKADEIHLTDEQKKLAGDNYRLAYFFAHRTKAEYLSDDEKESAALYGLCKAAAYFDPSKSKFSTYAQQCCWSAISRENFLAERKHRRGISNYVSFQAAERQGRTDSGSDAMHPPDRHPDAPNQMEEDERLEAVRTQLEGVLDRMTPRERLAWETYSSIGSLELTGEVMGVTRERVRQLLMTGQWRATGTGERYIKKYRKRGAAA